jgi:hypothetical protein
MGRLRTYGHPAVRGEEIGQPGVNIAERHCDCRHSLPASAVSQEKSRCWSTVSFYREQTPIELGDANSRAREMEVFLAGYILISICEIFSVGEFPLGEGVRLVRLRL